MDEEASIRLEPAGEVLQQSLDVAHLFEHFDRDNPIETPVGAEVIRLGAGMFLFGKIGDIEDDVPHIEQTAHEGLLHDELMLRARVRDGDDVGVGIAFGHPQAERSPTAAKIENALAIGNAGPLAGEGEHRLLSHGEVVDAQPPQAAAGFEVRAEHFQK